MRIFECPKCKADISDSFQGDDPSVGVYGGWYCEECKEGYPIPDHFYDESDFE